MEKVKIDQENPDLKLIKNAAGILKSSGIVIYPTDTAYGIGANALDENAVRKVYEIKGRDFSKPTHVVVRDWEMIESLCHTNNLAKKLFDKFMPGPITLILPKQPKVPNILTANLPTLGIRIPNNKVTKLLSNCLPFPYTTPSANKSGGTTPYSIDEVLKELDKDKIDLILNAGKLHEVAPSTIIDLSQTPPKILREGPIKKKKLIMFLNN